MKIYTQTYDLAKASPHRFWVAPFSEFKIGIKILEKDQISNKNFTVKAGSIELTPDQDKIDNFTLYTIKSNGTGFVEYTIEVEGVAEKLKLMQIVTDSTVFEIDAGGGDVPADVATQTWVNSQISNFVDEDALTAYYTKSETSSATELAEAFANVGGAISAFDMSENPVWSKTMVENAVKTDTCLPQTIVQYTDGTLSCLDISGTFLSSTVEQPVKPTIKGIWLGTNLSGIGPSGIGKIDNESQNWDNLEKIIIPDTITEYAIRAFFGINKAKRIDIPQTATGAGPADFIAWANSNSLTSISFGQLSSLGGSTVYNNGLKSLVEVKFGKNLQSIPEQCLRGAVNLEYILIPDSVGSIAVRAFYNAPKIKIDFGNTRTTIPTITSGSGFNKTFDTTAKIYVPDALYDTWVAASNWSDIASQIHRHSELEAPYATSKAEDAYNLADNANGQLGFKVDHMSGDTAPEVHTITTYYESEYSQLSVDDPGWQPDMNTMYVIIPDQK